MLTKKIFFGLCCLLLLASCKDKKSEEKPSIPTKKIMKPIIVLKGANYFFAPEFDTEKCEGIADCDCCSSNILFLDDLHFVVVYPCESDESVSRGTYRILNGKVILSHDTLQVNQEYVWNEEIDADTTGTLKPEYNIIIKSKPATTEVLNIKHCGDKLYFTTVVDKEIFYGTIDSRHSLEQQIKILKEEGLWDKIQ